jgi:hypothetical protein
MSEEKERPESSAETTVAGISSPAPPTLISPENPNAQRRKHDRHR